MEKSECFAQFESLGKASQPEFFDQLLKVIEIIYLFDDFRRDELSVVAEEMYCYRAPAGCQILYEGESGDFMMLLLEGTVEIVKLDGSGHPQRIGTAKAGKTLGEMSLIDGDPRSASCLALSPVTFATLDREHLSHIFETNPKIGIKILTLLVLLLNQRLRTVNHQLVELLDHRADWL